MSSLPKLGIVAGGGDLPALVVESCQAAGRDFLVIALEGQAVDPMLETVPHIWLRLGAAQSAKQIVQNENIQEVVLVGKVQRPSLKDLRPDKLTAKVLLKAGLKAFGDDGILRAIVQEIESWGTQIVGVETILTDIVAVEGVWGRIKPNDQARSDIARGIEVAKAIGGMDIGQGVVVQQGLVIGVEAIEGTDELIARCGPLLHPGPGGVLVKVCKPGQERRVDLPSIGTRTIEVAAKAGLCGIAVESGSALVVNQREVVTFADAAKLFVMGVKVKV